jgi:DNA replication and repair protein RecF
VTERASRIEQPRAQRLERLVVHGFRNLGRQAFAPAPRFNVIHGENGAGKSNVLEAIDYVATLESFRGARTDDLVELGSERALLEAKLDDEPLARVFRVELSKSAGRRLSIDGKRPRTRAVWRASFHAVLFHPGHLDLCTGRPEGRRAYLDGVLVQIDTTFASALATYERALRSRNRLLKALRVDKRAVTAFDAILADSGAVIGRARVRLLRDLAPEAERAFGEITDSALPLEVRYAPKVEPEVSALRSALERSYERDLERKYTGPGPHADDLVFDVRDRALAKHHASQGQQRALVLALKIAELDVLTRFTRRVPLLLLDDVSSELDRGRNQRFFSRLEKLGGQVFLTTTHPEFIRLDQHRTDFRVSAGRIERA